MSLNAQAWLFVALRMGCVIGFTLLIPALVWVQRRHPGIRAWKILVLAAAIGSVLPLTHKILEEPMHIALELAQRADAQACMRNAPMTQNADGSVDFGCQYGIGDWLGEPYHPARSLLYGPVYLLCCWAAAWAWYRPAARRWRLRITLVAIGVLVATWLAIVGYQLSPPAIFSDEIFLTGWNPFFGPQLSIPLAVLVAALLITRRRPTQLSRPD